MLKFAKYLGLLAMVAGTAACSVESVVNDLQDQVKAKAEAQLKDAFSSAVTEVALKAIQQGQDGQQPAAAPGYSAAVSDMSMNDTFDIDDSFTEDGATFTMKGTIKMVMDGGNSTMTMDMKATWTNLKVTLDDGTTVLTNGEQTIKGDFKTELTDPNDYSTMVMSMSMTTAGKISNVEGTADSTFDITMSFNSTDGKMKITGTIDGEPYSEEFDMSLGDDFGGDNTGGPDGMGGNGTYCTSQTGDVCYEFTAADATCPGDAPVVATTACDTSAIAGFCTFDAFTATENTRYSAVDYQTECETAGGIWTPAL